MRRTAVLAQLHHRTDRRLLRHVVEANVDDPSFWLRKAIGWALRSPLRLHRSRVGPGRGRPARGHGCRDSRVARPSTPVTNSMSRGRHAVCGTASADRSAALR
ncbi:MAG: DNA alkylation repair protein [Nocardioidaceae bacterium]